MTAFTFTVTRTGDTTVASTVDWAVTGTGGNPANAADFVGGVLPSGTVNFGVGDSSEDITINVNADVDVETDETFTVTLSNSSRGLILTATAIGTIVNDDVSSSTVVVRMLMGLGI